MAMPHSECLANSGVAFSVTPVALTVDLDRLRRFARAQADPLRPILKRHYDQNVSFGSDKSIKKPPRKRRNVKKEKTLSWLRAKRTVEPTQGEGFYYRIRAHAPLIGNPSSRSRPPSIDGSAMDQSQRLGIGLLLGRIKRIGCAHQTRSDQDRSTKCLSQIVKTVKGSRGKKSKNLRRTEVFQNFELFGRFCLVSDVRFALRAYDDLLVDEHVPDRVRGLGAFGDPVLDAVGVQFVALFLAAAIDRAEVFQISSPRIAALVHDNKAERRFLGFSDA